MVGLDTNFENVQFACLEIDYGDTMNRDDPICTGRVRKYLTVYLLDLGLNTVIKHHQEEVHESAHMLIAVPA
jgi:hypothetical protein